MNFGIFSLMGYRTPGTAAAALYDGAIAQVKAVHAIPHDDALLDRILEADLNHPDAWDLGPDGRYHRRSSEAASKPSSVRWWGSTTTSSAQLVGPRLTCA